MNEMRKLMEAVAGLSEGITVNYDYWKTPVIKNLNSKHIAILQLMSDGERRERTDMIRTATNMDPNPRSSGGFAGWNKLDYDLYKKGLLDVVAIQGGRKIFQINKAGLAALNSYIDEACQGGKTEHSGAKHGKGAYYGRKKDAKRDSNKNRRRAAKASAARPVELALDEDIDPKTGDIRTHQRNDAEFMQDIINLTDEADEILGGDDRNPAEQLDGLATIMQDISNITRLRVAGKPYAPIHEAEADYLPGGKHYDLSSDKKWRETTGGDEPDETKYTRQYGNVTVDFDGDEVLITHGHGENIFLSMEEWKEFAGEIQDIFIQ